jgi:hypothetical protein
MALKDFVTSLKTINTALSLEPENEEALNCKCMNLIQHHLANITNILF